MQFSELRDEHLPLLRSSHAGGCEHGYARLELSFQCLIGAVKPADRLMTERR